MVRSVLRAVAVCVLALAVGFPTSVADASSPASDGPGTVDTVLTTGAPRLAATTAQALVTRGTERQAVDRTAPLAAALLSAAVLALCALLATQLRSSRSLPHRRHRCSTGPGRGPPVLV